MGYKNRGQADLLFNKANWFNVEENQRRKMLSEIQSLNGDKLLNTSTEDLSQYFRENFEISVPELDHDNITVEERETQVDVRYDSNRFIRDTSRPVYVSGTAIDVEVPFSGDKAVFDVQPNTYDLSPPRAHISEGIVYFCVEGASLTAEQVQSKISREVESIEKYLNWMRGSANQFNESLYNLSKSNIESRKEKILASKTMVAGLGYKMKPRSGSSETYSAPVAKRKVIKQPQASSAPYTPEPILDEQEYHHILKVMENMVKVMELSPGAFSTMDEESLRSHFLVQLNSQYEGNASGETFNYEGKTDIIIKEKGRNIFIAECKFWGGEKAYLETIDQLMKYVSWRDTKTAILIFNRNKNFSGVLDTVETSTSKHQNYKKQITKRSETSWEYLFSQAEDSNREMIVTVQVYNIPENIQPRVRPL